jgi:hypothetical protein
MPFEKVESTYSIGAKISIRKSGTVGFNEAFIKEYFENYENVEIYYDEDSTQIGFRGIEESTNASYTISEQSSGATVGCTSFLKRNDLVPQVTTRYEPQQQKLNDDVELIVIDLDDPIGTYGYPDDDEDSKED